jgi:hypothetical protein
MLCFSGNTVRAIVPILVYVVHSASSVTELELRDSSNLLIDNSELLTLVRDDITASRISGSSKRYIINCTTYTVDFTRLTASA